jgi:hypothetical protein
MAIQNSFVTLISSSFQLYLLGPLNLGGGMRGRGNPDFAAQSSTELAADKSSISRRR